VILPSLFLEATNHAAHPEGDEDFKRAVIENLGPLDRAGKLAVLDFSRRLRKGESRPNLAAPIASDLHDALWATFVVQALPAGPQHCHPRARVPVPECSEVSQPGLPSCLMGCR
jgi:hypothetical protein